MTVDELQALACEDCPATITVQRGQGMAGPVLTVVVEHQGSCPWARTYVPAGGALLVKPGAMLRHIVAGEADTLHASAG